MLLTDIRLGQATYLFVIERSAYPIVLCKANAPVAKLFALNFHPERHQVPMLLVHKAVKRDARYPGSRWGSLGVPGSCQTCWNHLCETARDTTGSYGLHGSGADRLQPSQTPFNPGLPNRLVLWLLRAARLKCAIIPNTSVGDVLTIGRYVLRRREDM